MQRDRAVIKDGIIKDRDGNGLTSDKSVLRRWKEYIEELMYVENERERSTDGGKRLK